MTGGGGYGEEHEEYGSNPWLPRARPPSPGDWVRGDPGQVGAGLLLDAGPWLLLAAFLAIGAADPLIAVAGALMAVACVSLAVGAVTKRSLAMRLTGWPVADRPAHAELGAAWVELFVLIIIVLCDRFFASMGLDLSVAVAGCVCLVAALSAVLLVTTGASLGRRLLLALRNF